MSFLRPSVRSALALVAVLAGLCAPAAGARITAARITAATVLHAPVRAVHFPGGRIGYREVGRGSPLVIIMGLAGSIDAWPPSFVAGLAGHHRVIALDNEGIGLSTLGVSPLSIERMADDTAALVRALRLARPDVLGWSMGGFIAQAYAVRHSRGLRRLILAATAPGDGKGTLPNGPALTALSSANGAAALQYLFPPDQAKYQTAYIKEIAGYPEFHLPSAAVVKMQLSASAVWLTGATRSGHLVGRLSLPVLIGDGREDELLPAANSVHLGRLIKASSVKLYPDAGHGFLFQDEGSWVATIERFLGAKPAAAKR